MRIYHTFLFGCLLVLATGCGTSQGLGKFGSQRPASESVSPPPEAAAPQYEDEKVFRLSLVTEPAESTMRWSEGSSGEKKVMAPGRFEFRFVKVAADGFLGQIGGSTWRPYIPPGQPWLGRETDEGYEFKTHPIVFEKEGFKPETASFTWWVPKDFTARNEEGYKKGPLATERNERVVFRVPTKPRIGRKINLTGSPEGVKIFALNKDGSKGELVSETPFVAKLGFASERNKNGEFVRWRRWVYQKPDIWECSKDGDLRLNAVLEREGFQPEVLVRHPVLQVEPKQAATHTAVLQMTTPSVPEAQFTLHMDSLPSSANIYILNDDGSLGQKLGTTPAQLIVGMGQQSEFNPKIGYVHKDWLIWDEHKLLRKITRPDGSAVLMLSCALYLEGFAPNYVTQPLFELAPGVPYPAERILNIPLLKPEHAAARELQKKMVPIPAASAPQASQPSIRDSRRTFVWKSPEEESSDQE